MHVHGNAVEGRQNRAVKWIRPLACFVSTSIQFRVLSVICQEREPFLVSLDKMKQKKRSQKLMRGSLIPIPDGPDRAPAGGRGSRMMQKQVRKGGLWSSSLPALVGGSPGARMHNHCSCPYTGGPKSDVGP